MIIIAPGIAGYFLLNYRPAWSGAGLSGEFTSQRWSS
jgi:hypothetical protein